MVRLSVLIVLGAVSGIALAQDRDKDGNLERPTACEFRAYYLDHDNKPCDTKDVSAAVVFENREGKNQKYPMTLVQSHEKSGKTPACHYFNLAGTDYRFATVVTCSDASVPGGNTHSDKPFLKPLPVIINPEGKTTLEKGEVSLADCAYFKVYLNKDDIEAIDKANYTDVSVVWTIHKNVIASKCYSCLHGRAMGAPCSRISADLKTLESQVSANEMDQAKVTMARIRENVAALPKSAATEKTHGDCANCCKDLDHAVNAGDKEKSLKEIHKLEAKCEACDSACEADAKPDHKK
jgi:hypothetical protein